eukprot:scaffold15.g4369.t1
MVALNVVLPTYAGRLITRVRGTITVQTMTTELGDSRLLHERTRTQATLEAATSGGTVASGLEQAVADATAAAAAVLGFTASAAAGGAAASGAATAAASDAAEAVAAAAADPDWPRTHSLARRRRLPNLLSEWQCSPEGLRFTSQAQQSQYWLPSLDYVIKYNHTVPKYQWCRGARPELVPQLRQVLLMRSDKPRPPRGLTVVTQLSVERFSMLENQCRSWPYQISATLYVPLVGGRMFSAEDKAWHKQPVDAAIVQALKFHAHAEACPTCCILDLEVVVEERCERQPAMLYPANAVRNRALLRAETEAVLLLDVDFCPSRELAAAEAPGKALALKAVASGKEFVAEEWRQGRLVGFHTAHYSQGHGPTRFRQWIGTSAPYAVNWTIGFEPYIVMARKFVPFYDERYRGYYWNKVQHLMHVHLQNGFEYVVHPRAFVVHVPHPQPSTKWLTRHSGQKERNHAMFLEALELMGQQLFVPVTSFPELCVPLNVRSVVEGVSKRQLPRPIWEAMNAPPQPPPTEQQPEQQQAGAATQAEAATQDAAAAAEEADEEGEAKVEQDGEEDDASDE